MKKQIVTGLIGAASLLAMAATTSYAIQTTTCSDATIISVGAGYQNSGLPTGPYRMIGLECNDNPSLSGVFPVYPSSLVDRDGIMATALTALKGNTLPWYYPCHLVYTTVHLMTGNSNDFIILFGLDCPMEIEPLSQQ